MSSENQIHDAEEEEEEEEERRALIDSSILTVHENGEDRSSLSVTTTNQRLVSLDVFRGLTVAVRLLSFQFNCFINTVFSFFFN